MMEIRKAAETEYDAVRAFYHSVIDCTEDAEFSPMWIKDIYPAPEYLRESIENGELYLGLLGGEIAAAMVLNHQYNDGYNECNWQTDAADSEITVIHTLGVHPKFSRQGLAKQMVTKAFEAARENGQKAIRLDVLEGNLPAEKLYPALGFRYIDTVNLYYDDTGWTVFKLYEYVL